MIDDVSACHVSDFGHGNTVIKSTVDYSGLHSINGPKGCRLVHAAHTSSSPLDSAPTCYAWGLMHHGAAAISTHLLDWSIQALPEFRDSIAERISQLLVSSAILPNVANDRRPLPRHDLGVDLKVEDRADQSSEYNLSTHVKG